MQQTVRTTIRIQKDLHDESRLLAIKRNARLQDVINEALRIGMYRIADKNSRKKLMKEIDQIRKRVSLSNKEVQEILDENKKQLQDRTDRILQRLK